MLETRMTCDGVEWVERGNGFVTIGGHFTRTIAVMVAAAFVIDFPFYANHFGCSCPTLDHLFGILARTLGRA